MSRLGRNVSANLLGNGWATALSLVLTPLYVKLLGVESFGLIGFYVSWVALLGILDTGISATAVRETAWLSARPEESGSISSLLRTLEISYWSIILTLGVGLFAAATWFGGAWFRSVTVPPDVVRAALMLMVVSLVVQVPSGLYVGGLMGLQRQVECSALMAFFGTVRGLGAVGALVFVRPDIRVFFAWQVVASALQTWVMRWSLTRQFDTGRQPARFSVTMLRAVKGFAGETSLVTALSLVLNQADKMILSRLVSLELFGLYMLAWTVASGLSRVSTPLVQAFSPRFTELVSSGDERELGRQVRLASQLTSTLVLPPAALLALLAAPILIAWTGNPVVARGAAPFLSVIIVGTLLSACAFPAVSVLYSRKQLKPVIAVNAAAVVFLLPLLAVTVITFGPMAAAWCWVLYGLVIYTTYQALGLAGLLATGKLSAIAHDFVAPGLASLGVAAVARQVSTQLNGRLEIVALVGVALVAGWLAALLSCRDLFRNVASALGWNTNATLWSA